MVVEMDESIRQNTKSLHDVTLEDIHGTVVKVS